MDLNKMTIFRLMGDKMSWDSQRQTVLSQNIANADTPNYQPEDLVPFSFKAEMDRQPQLAMLTDQPGQISNVTDASSPAYRSQGDRPGYEVKPDGNGVGLEDQMNRMSQNNIDFQTVTNLLQAQTKMLRTALGQSGA